MKYKIIVAHPGKQHSFRLASALKKNDRLYKYITTVYDKQTSVVMKLVKRFLNKDNLTRANGRKNADLSDNDVVQYYELSGLIEIFLARYDKKRNLYNWWQRKTADRFGIKVAELAIEKKVDAVIMYDTNANTCFEKLKREAPSILRILDTSAANRLYMKQIYEKDMDLCEGFSDSLLAIGDYLQDDKICKRLEQEIKDTTFFLTPSRFVAESLEYSGVEKCNIGICPYGTNFPVVEHRRTYEKGPIKAIYVGNVTEIKGIYYLLEAIMQIPKESVQLTIVGAYDTANPALKKYKDRVEFIGRTPHGNVKKLLEMSDIFVFASLGEGMSLAVLEALSCGLPCVVTRNSGVNDIVVDGKNGFEIDIQNVEAIKEKILWFVENKSEINRMSNEAIQSVKNLTWNDYEKKVVEVIEAWLENRS